MKNQRASYSKNNRGYNGLLYVSGVAVLLFGGVAVWSACMGWISTDTLISVAISLFSLIFTAALVVVSWMSRDTQAVMVQLSDQALSIEKTVRKNAQDPNLRIYHVEWKYEKEQGLGSSATDKPVFIEMGVWSGEILLWNTGTGAILIEKWMIENASAHDIITLRADGAGMLAPVLLGAQETMDVVLKIKSERKPKLTFVYSTSLQQGRQESIEPAI